MGLSFSPLAPNLSNGQLRATLAKAILAVDPKGANERHRKARTDRRVSVNEQPEGMASLWAYLSAPDARSAWEWLTRLARGLDTDDPRGMDARRADLLVALLTGKITFTDPTDDPNPNPDPGSGSGSGSGETVREDAPGTLDTTGLDAAGEDDEDGAAGKDGEDGGEGADPEPGTTGTTGTTGTDDEAGSATRSKTDSTRTSGTEPGTTPAPQAAPVQRARMRRNGTLQLLPTRDPDPGVQRDPARPARERINPVTPGKPLVTVVMPHTTLTGTDDQICELTGYGPIPADLAREIAADAVWKRLLYDPISGTVLDYGRTTYHPPVGLADHVRARDLLCRGPRCPKPATATELDHHVPFPDGPTSEPNLTALCKHDHDLKHHGGWGVELQPDGSLRWTTPTGYSYTTHPRDYRPDPIDLESGLPEPRPAPPPYNPDDDPAPF